MRYRAVEEIRNLAAKESEGGQEMQYYWVWIPSGVTRPAPPLPPAG